MLATGLSPKKLESGWEDRQVSKNYDWGATPYSRGNLWSFQRT